MTFSILPPESEWPDVFENKSFSRKQNYLFVFTIKTENK